jgi:hypothetical protein
LVESARRDAKRLIIRAGSKRLADDASGLDRHHRREDAGKVRMQCAARVGEVSALIAMIMGLSFVPVNMHMLMMVVRSGDVRNRLRAGTRRRHDARKLRDQKQGDQQSDKPTHRPKPIHLRLDRSPRAILPIMGASHWNVNSEVGG